MSGNAVSRSSTHRVRRHRQRLAAGVRFVARLHVEVTPEIVAGLIERGLLVPDRGQDGAGRVTRAQIIHALDRMISHALPG